MTIRERTVDSVVVLDLSGRLVLGDGDQLLKETVQNLIASGRKHIVLNLAEVSYVDSSGLGSLVDPAWISAQEVVTDPDGLLDDLGT